MSHPNVADLVEACAEGLIPFDGPRGLVRLVAEMGFPTDGLLAMVTAAREDIAANTAPALVSEPSQS